MKDQTNKSCGPFVVCGEWSVRYWACRLSSLFFWLSHLNLSKQFTSLTAGSAGEVHSLPLLHHRCTNDLAPSENLRTQTCNKITVNSLWQLEEFNVRGRLCGVTESGDCQHPGSQWLIWRSRPETNRDGGSPAWHPPLSPSLLMRAGCLIGFPCGGRTSCNRSFNCLYLAWLSALLTALKERVSEYSTLWMLTTHNQVQV